MRLLTTLLLLFLAGCVTQTSYKSSNRPVTEHAVDPVASAKTRISLGLTYLSKQQMSQAKYNLDKALQFAPNLAEAHYSLGYYYQRVGDFELAKQAYKRALKLAPNDPDAHNNYGVFLCEQHRFEQAIKHFKQAIGSSQYAKSAETYENMAWCSLQNKQAQQSIEYLEKSLNHEPNRIAVIQQLIAQLTKAGRYQRANYHLTRLVKVAPLTADTMWLAYQLADAQQQSDRAQQWLHKMIEQFPDSPLSKPYLGTRSND